MQPYVGDYIEDGYSPDPIFLNEEVYSKVLDTIVISCVDILPTYRGEVLIAKRAYHPQADWWLFGGRMRPGEQLKVSAKRIFHKDTGLLIEDDRFVYLSTFSAAWRKRAHEPENNGTHTVSIVMTVELRQDEFEIVSLSNEYVGSQLISPDAIMGQPSYHPALRQCVEDVKRLKG